MSADTPAKSPQAFGCSHCWPTSADAAWDALRGLTREAELIAESHFHVMLRACPRCAQRFVSVFTETIDWDDGEDPQYWTVLPVTAEEATALGGAGDGLDEGHLDALAPDRRSLHHDHAKDEPARSYWSSGIMVGPHD